MVSSVGVSGGGELDICMDIAIFEILQASDRNIETYYFAMVNCKTARFGDSSRM